MQYRKFGNTGVEISTLGFGCMRLPEIDLGDGKFEVDQEKTDAMLRHAYDLGVNYFDTAYYYCHENSEIAVGKALKPIRDKVYVATKCPLDRVKKAEDFEGMPFKLDKVYQKKLFNLNDLKMSNEYLISSAKIKKYIKYAYDVDRDSENNNITITDVSLIFCIILNKVIYISFCDR